MRYIARRALLLLLTGWAALTINFALPRLMPGSPIEAMAAKYAGRLTPSALAAISKALGLDNKQDIFVQYWTYLGHTLTGNFGYSLSEYPTKVSTLLGQNLPWTLGLVGFATVVAFVLGTFIGAVAAWKRGSVFDSLVVPTGMMLGAMPSFWISTMALYWLSYRLGWFPLFGGSSSGSLASVSGISSVLSHAALPAIVLAVISLGGFMLVMRNTTVSVMSDDYVKFARAKGLRNFTVASRYAARNATLPVVTNFALALGTVVAGTIFVEYVFSYPGIADLLYTAVVSEDYPLMQAIFLVIVLAVLLANFIADMLYVVLDPRIRVEGRG